MDTGVYKYINETRLCSLCVPRAREAAPSGGPNPARALDRAAADFFLTSSTAAVAAASEVSGQLRQDGIATARAAALARPDGLDP